MLAMRFDLIATCCEWLILRSTDHREHSASKFATVNNSQETEKITHLGEAAHYETSYNGHLCKCVVGSGVSPRPLERRQTVKTVRLNHPGAALLAVAAAGLLAAVGLLAVLYAQPAEANYPGTPGKIYYSGWDGQDLEIYSVDPDGGSIVRVTQNQLANWEPAYSPTGKKVAYSGWDGQDWEIYTSDLDGGSRVNVTQNNADDRHPYYSPNGTRIAYSSDADGDWDIYTISTTGGSRQNVTQ